MFLDRVPQIGDFLQMGIFIIFFWILSHLQTFTDILRNILVMRLTTYVTSMSLFFFKKLVDELTNVFLHWKYARLHTNTVEC